jgi:hypothetical protein
MSLTILAEPAPLVVNADGVVLIGKTRVTLDRHRSRESTTRLNDVGLNHRHI